MLLKFSCHFQTVQLLFVFLLSTVIFSSVHCSPTGVDKLPRKYTLTYDYLNTPSSPEVRSTLTTTEPTNSAIPDILTEEELDALIQEIFAPDSTKTPSTTSSPE